MGTTPKNLLDALAQIKKQIAEARAELMAMPDDEPPITSAIEKASIAIDCLSRRLGLM